MLATRFGKNSRILGAKMKNHTLTTRCMICQEEKECRFLPIFVIGSEGLYCCHSCEMAILEFIRGMMRLSARSRKHGYAMAKKVRESRKKFNIE